MSELPVVVIGAGPQGLAAASHLLERGLPVLVLESGATAGAAVRDWAHVRMFSSWQELIDPAARRLLKSAGWEAPREGYPTGGEWVEGYLSPLAAALDDRVRVGRRVAGVARRGRDLTVSSGRAAAPFVVHVAAADGTASRVLARAVIDASGTWSTPNPAGSDGYPAAGEEALGTRISYRIPDEMDACAGRHVVIIGAGHSAAHAAIRLGELAGADGSTRVTWLVRRESGTRTSGDGDALPERAALGRGAQRAVESGTVKVVRGFRVAEFAADGDAITIISDAGDRIEQVAQVVALTGFRPDFSLVSELRLAIDPALQAVAGIAAAIDPNMHSCGTVEATGARQLVQPEQDFFIVGAKSYGRAPTFLALTGYEQVRSVVAHLAGDHDAAARNELVLPETGACGGAGEFGEAGGTACCAPAPQRIELGVGAVLTRP